MRLLIIFCLTILLAPLNPPVSAAEAVQNVGSEGLKQVNAIRARHGLQQLQLNAKLAAAAQMHARSMVKYKFFSHDGPGNSTPGSRARSQGYNYCRIAENIAKGQKNLETVMKTWMNSPGHRKNILSRDVNEFSLVLGAGNIWVMVLGRRGC